MRKNFDMVLHVINSLVGRGAENLLISLSRELPNIRILLLQNKIDFDVEPEIRARITTFGAASPYDPRVMYKLKSIMRHYKIVHVHLFPSLYWAAMARPLGTTLVYTEHSTSNKRRRNALFRFTDRLAYRRYHKIIAVSKGTAYALQKDLGIGAQKIEVINNGVDLSRFFPLRPPLPEPEGEFRVLMVSSFSAAKDQDTVVRALALLPRRFCLVLAGNGPRMNDVERRATELGVAHRVEFPGFVDKPQELYAGCHLAVQSSHWEGFGLATVEAMASGLPVLVSDIPGLQEVVHRREQAFSAGDHEELAQLITALAKDMPRYCEAATQSKQRAQLFSISHTAQQLQLLYKTFGTV